MRLSDNLNILKPLTLEIARLFNSELGTPADILLSQEQKFHLKQNAPGIIPVLKLSILAPDNE